MRRKFTLLVFVLFVSIVNAIAGTPSIDGVFDGTAVWGSPRASGDGTDGWAGTNAKNFYVTWDANYVYFGAECTAASWQQYIFVVNTKDGGNGTDPWGRTITYNHTNKPDFLFRGDIAQGNYSQYQVWDGAAWTGTTDNINAAGTEVKGGGFTGSGTGFIEIRVPYSTIGNIDAMDVQFIITGNNGGAASGHGCFDAIPNDQNCTDWNAPGNASVVSNYAPQIVLPLTLASFSGALKNGIVSLNWKTTAEVNLKNFEIEKSTNGTAWTNVGAVTARNSAVGATYNFNISNAKEQFLLLRLKMIDKDGQFSYSKTVTIMLNSGKTISIIGNPAINSIKVSINQNAAANFQAVLFSLDGKKVTGINYQHAGGSSVMELKTAGIAPGLYLLNISSAGTKETLKVVIR